MSSIVLSTSDYQRLVSLASDSDPRSSPSALNRSSLHAQSLSRSSKWGNTVDALRVRKDQARKERLEERERLQQIIDQEEAAVQEQERTKAVEKARKIIAARSDKVKIFDSALRESDVLEERKRHERLREFVKQKEKQRDEYFECLIEQNQQKLLEREERDEKVRSEKDKQVAKDQLIQLKLYQEKHMEMQRLEMEEGERIKRDVELKKQEDFAKLIKLKEKARIANAENVAKNKELEQLKKDEIVKNQEYLDSIEQYAKKKESLVLMRKQKEAERFSQKMAQRQMLIDTQAAILANMKDEEGKRLGNQIKEAEAKQEARDKDDAEKREALKQSIANSRRRANERKEMEARLKKEEEIKFATKWRQSMAELDEEDVQLQAEEFRKTLVLQEFLKKQISEKPSSKPNYDEYLKESRAKAQQEEEEFQEYAAAMIAEYASKGRNTKPLIRQLAKTKKRVL